MIKCECLYDNDNNYIIEYAYNIQEFRQYINDNGGFLSLDTKSGYLTHPVTYDIETTTIQDQAASLKEDKPIYTAYMYHWQMCVEHRVIFGRTWDEFQKFLDLLVKAYKADKNRKIVIYVHNLSFEWVFTAPFVTVNKVFATDLHKILRATINDCIELRCSYYLSNMRLEKFIENSPGCHHIKATSDLDYRKVRTSATELTERELGYCYNDVAGLYERINSRLLDDDLKTIPMTATGYVRRDCRNAMRKNPYNRKQFLNTQLTDKQYLLLKDVFRGGNTRSNRYATGFIIDNVDSYDIKSSYPFVMLSQEYPTGKFMFGNITSMQELQYYNNKYCTIGYYYFDKIAVKQNIPIPYLPVSKCTHIENVTAYNGRILERQNVVIGLTNIDFDIINEQYDIEGLSVSDFYFARRGLLPKELREQVLKYFFKKSELDGIPDKVYEYNKSKNALNSLYGMMVTDTIRDDFVFENGEIVVKQNDKTIQEQLNDYYKNRNNFLSYQWGVFVTRYARRQLQRGINAICQAGGRYDIIYCDTDSIKYAGNYDSIFDRLNNDILTECQKKSIIHSVKVRNKTFILGLFNKEKGYDHFITLGAKKYAYEQGGKIGVTVSGLNKKQGAQELIKKGGLSAFKIGETFFNSGRTVAYYNTEPVHDITVNGVTMVTRSNIAIVDTTYTLGITDTMKSILISLGVM